MHRNYWPRLVRLLLIVGLCLAVASVSAQSYRWKDKDGKTHYGASLPPEYADQPYDILNSAGLVIQHVENAPKPAEEIVEKVTKEREPLISDEERQRQSDRLLIVRYQSEEDIKQALALEIVQLGYDSKIVQQSFESADAAIRDQIRLAAEQQRAGGPIGEEQQDRIDKLYRRLARDEKKITALNNRETSIRTRYQATLDRYRLLILQEQEKELERKQKREQKRKKGNDEEQVDQV